MHEEYATYVANIQARGLIPGEEWLPLAGKQALWLMRHYSWTILPAHRAIRDGAGGVRCTCTRGVKCPTPGKHPKREWNPRAVPGPLTAGAMVQEWERDENERANMAILTGMRSGIVVADIDPRHGGTLDALLDAGWLLETCMARSGGDGIHVYAAIPAGVTAVRSLPQYLPGIEVKADGALVIAPPSLHPSGKRYEWAPLHTPKDYAPAHLPDAVWAAIAQRPQPVTRARAATASERAAMQVGRDIGWSSEQVRAYAVAMYRRAFQKVDELGSRNCACYWLARQLQSVGFSESDMRVWVRAFGDEVRFQ